MTTTQPTTRSAARSKPLLTTVLALTLTIALTVLLDLRLGPLPALGRLLDPFGGFWRNAESDAPWAGEQELDIPGLRQPVQVVVDERLVPHIFAQNDHDLYLAQGYLTARLRLWQMDLQTRAAGGMVSEIMGDQAIAFDKDRRRVGMMAAAERAMVYVKQDSATWNALSAYVAGVNAYINQLSPKDYPLEYKLVGAAPAQWTELRCLLLLKYMAWDLSGYSPDWAASHTLAKLGQAQMDRFYPNYPERMDPIIPLGIQWNFTPLAAPPVPDNYLSTALDTSPDPTAKLASVMPPRRPGYGSNNWAVHGSKTASGLPILANDPHLQLNLPSIWLEIQLHSPSHNVYGVSLPGAPGVVIGYNNDIAWGVTNVGSDVRDWYRIKFRDASRREYQHDGQWKQVERRVETIHLKDGSTSTDTVLWTHHGPVVFPDTLAGKRNPIGFACRWVALDSSNEVRTFHRLNRARNYDEYKDALKTFVCPAQNFAFISRDNNIALWVNGKFPLKWEGQGKYILDGSDPSHDWPGWIPQPQNPHVLNPPRGFVSSANQHSTDKTYPYYLDNDQESFERGARINQRLAAMNGITPDSLLGLQNDEYNLHAAWILPTVNARLARLNLSGQAAAARAELAKWNAWNRAGSIGSTIFNAWFDQFTEAAFADELAARPRLYPSRDQVSELIMNDTLNPILDNVNTPAKENLASVLDSSFHRAVRQLQAERGPLGKAWAWGKVKNTTIRYLLDRDGKTFSRFSHALPQVGGGDNIVQASQPRNGPSWKMIVAMTPTGPSGYGVYPGGQSGNPGSKYFDNFMSTWAAGKNYPHRFLERPELPGALAKLTLKGK